MKVAAFNYTDPVRVLGKVCAIIAFGVWAVACITLFLFASDSFAISFFFVDMINWYACGCGGITLTLLAIVRGEEFFC